MKKKITIVGAGNVGATLALYAVMNAMGDIVLVDVNEGMAKGKALDMIQASAVFGLDVNVIGTSDYAQTADSDIVIITAGLARKPGMDRLDLLKKNADIIKEVTGQIVAHSPHTIIIVVSNPVDVMTYHALTLSGFEKHRVIGQAGVLDSARFSTFIAEALSCSVKDISPLVLGGHGDEMVPLTQYTTVSGVPVDTLLPPEKLASIIDRTRKGGAEIVNLLQSGSAYYAPASATCAMVAAILQDTGKVLPCSVLLTGEYGIRDVCVGVPVKLGAKGIQEIITLPLAEPELAALRTSADGYKKSIAELA